MLLMDLDNSWKLERMDDITCPKCCIRKRCKPKQEYETRYKYCKPCTDKIAEKEQKDLKVFVNV